jgi:WD40 repeat protein
MIKRSCGGESSSAARKRQVTSAPLDEHPLVPSSQEQHASSVASMIPINLIAALVLPYIQDRSTWNSVCFANKELRDAGKRMRPPWPNTMFSVEGHGVRTVAFSPCKSFLALSIVTHPLVYVWDRHGEQTQLEGHIGGVSCLQYSLDRKYLASGSLDKSIRLWRITFESAAHSSSSDESRLGNTTRGTLQAQSVINLLGHGGTITSLTFSPTDSNLLASGCNTGEIRLWDVINQVCIHAFDFNPRLRSIEAIFFSPGDNIQCYVVTSGGPMIRIARNRRMEFAATILEEPGEKRRYKLVAFSPCGTFFAAISDMDVPLLIGASELALFDLGTMAKTQSVVLSGGGNYARIAISSDGKKLAITSYRNARARLIECHDLTIQQDVDTIEQRSSYAVAFDPTNRFLAIARRDGRVELRTL